MIINNEYKVESDELNVVLLRRTKDKNGEFTENYTPIAYYPSLGKALIGLADREIMGLGLYDLEKTKMLIDELRTYIEKLVSDLSETN